MTSTQTLTTRTTAQEGKTEAEIASAVAAIKEIQDVLDLIESDYAGDHLFALIPTVFTKENLNLSPDTYYSYFYTENRAKIIRAILQSPKVTENFLDEWRNYYWGTPQIAAEMIISGEHVNEVCLAIALKWQYPTMEFQKLLMKSEHCTPDLMSVYAQDTRLTILRLVAKHSMLTKEGGQHLLEHKDAVCRLNVLTQNWVTNEQVYLMRDDRNPLIAKAARKELAERGLPETDELDETLEDEVGTFFLLAAEDEETMIRIGASNKTQEDNLRTIANSNFPRAVVAVAGNTATPVSLLDEMTLTEAPTSEELKAKGLYWKGNDRSLRVALASNPNNSTESVERLLNESRYQEDVVIACVTNHLDISSAAINSALVNGNAKSRIALLKTKKVSQNWVQRIVERETRISVLCTLIEHYSETLSGDDLELLMCSDNAKVRVMATEAHQAKIEQMRNPA